MPRDDHGIADGAAYGRKALADECRAIRTAPFGTQAITLNRACFSIGTLAGSGGLDQAEALAELEAAAFSMPSQSGREPWSRMDLERKVRDAFRDGLENPRGALPRAKERPIRPAKANGQADGEAGVVQIRVTPKTRNPFTIKALSISGVTWNWHVLNLAAPGYAPQAAFGRGPGSALIHIGFAPVRWARNWRRRYARYAALAFARASRRCASTACRAASRRRSISSRVGIGTMAERRAISRRRAASTAGSVSGQSKL